MLYATCVQSLMLILHLLALWLLEKLHERLEDGKYLEALIYMAIAVAGILAFGYALAYFRRKISGD